MSVRPNHQDAGRRGHRHQWPAGDRCRLISAPPRSTAATNTAALAAQLQGLFIVAALYRRRRGHAVAELVLRRFPVERRGIGLHQAVADGARLPPGRPRPGSTPGSRRQLLPSHLRRTPRPTFLRPRSSCSAGAKATPGTPNGLIAGGEAGRNGVEVRVIVDRYDLARTRRRARDVHAPGRGGSRDRRQRRVSDRPRRPLPHDQQLDWRQDEVGRSDHRKLFRHRRYGSRGREERASRITSRTAVSRRMVRVTGVCRAAGTGGLPGELPRPRWPIAGRSLPVLSRADGASARRRSPSPRSHPGGFVAATQAIREQIDRLGPPRRHERRTSPTVDMLERILAAARRGVNVQDRRPSEVRTTTRRPRRSSTRYADLIAAGAEVWELPSTVVTPRPWSPTTSSASDGEPRRLGSLPQLGDHDDRPEAAARRSSRSACSSPTSPAEARGAGLGNR